MPTDRLVHERAKANGYYVDKKENVLLNAAGRRYQARLRIQKILRWLFPIFKMKLTDSCECIGSRVD
jgi:hypothetical protein